MALGDIGCRLRPGQLGDRLPIPDAGADTGEVRDTVAILTRTALGAAAAIHPRMPLLIAAETMAAWLDPGRTERTDIEPLLALPPPQGLKASSGPGQPTQLVL